MSELKFGFKLVFYPFIFVIWVLYVMSHVRYVDSPDFQTYWEEL